MMGIIDRIVKNEVDAVIKREMGGMLKREIEKAMLNIAEDAVRGVVQRMWDTNPHFRFIKWGQYELQRVDPTLTDEKAFYLSRDTINEHLADEKIKFGDDGYSWDEDGAKEIMQAYQIDHWEQAHAR